MKKERISNTIDLILLIFFTVSSVSLCIQINLGKFLSVFWQILTIILLIIILVLFFTWILISKNLIGFRRILLILISISLGFASWKLNDMRNMINLSEETIKTYYRMSLVTDNPIIKDASEMKDERFGIMVSDRNYVQSFEDLDKAFQTENCEVREFHNLSNLVNALKKDEIQGMILSDHSIALLKQRFPEVTFHTLSENEHEVEISHVSKDKPITEPFTILMSINDGEVKLNYVSPTSQCLILFIDPIDKIVTSIKIPNNLYIPNVAYDSYPDALYNVSYNGIDNLLYSLESIFGIEFDYFIKTNSKSLMNAVDIMQGIIITKEICEEDTCEFVDEFYDSQLIIDYYQENQDTNSIIEGIFNKRNQLTTAKLLNFVNNFGENSFTNLSVNKFRDLINLMNKDETWTFKKIDMDEVYVSFEPCISYGMNDEHQVSIIKKELIDTIYSYFIQLKHLEVMKNFEFDLNQIQKGVFTPKTNEKLITTSNMSWKISNYFAFLPHSTINPIEVEKWQGTVDFEKPNFDPDAPIHPIE